jgi:hypothetical protein
MGALLALKAFGLARATADDDVRWLPTNKAIRYMKLDRFNLTQAQKKRAELDAAYNALLSFLPSLSPVAPLIPPHCAARPEDGLGRQPDGAAVAGRRRQEHRDPWTGDARLDA